jgi:hypothetical protein
MTNFIVCDTQADAKAALAVVDREKGFSDPRTMTSTWAIPRQRMDGKWAFPAPEPDVVAKITVPHTVEDKQDDWFPAVNEV